MDSNYFHWEAMLTGSIKLPGTSWQKKINENTALRTLLYLRMTINGAKLEDVQVCWLADCHSWLFLTSKCPTHQCVQPAKLQAASSQDSKLYKGKKHPVLTQHVVMKLCISFNRNCFPHSLCYYLSKQAFYLTN